MLPPKNIVEHCSEWGVRDTMVLLFLGANLVLGIWIFIRQKRWGEKGARLAFASGYFHGRLAENKHEPTPRTPEDWRTIMPRPLGTGRSDSDG